MGKKNPEFDFVELCNIELIVWWPGGIIVLVLMIFGLQPDKFMYILVFSCWRFIFVEGNAISQFVGLVSQSRISELQHMIREGSYLCGCGCFHMLFIGNKYKIVNYLLTIIMLLIYII